MSRYRPTSSRSCRALASFACGGNAYQYDGNSSVITKYTVEDDLSLTQGMSIRLDLDGIEGFSAAIICVSSTRAYIFNPGATRGVEWNPDTMVIVDSFDVPPPDVEDDLGVFIFEPVVSGDLAYFPVEASNFDTVDSSTRAVVATFDLTDESWTYTYKEGCSSGVGGYLGSDGTFYREPSYMSFFNEYGQQPDVPQCLLRILPGQKEFDASYEIDPGEVVNAYPIDDRYLLALRVDPSVPVPSPANLFDWFATAVVPTRIDRQTGDAQRYPGLSADPPENVRRLSLDGRRFYQQQEYNADGRTARTRILELFPDGPSEPAFVVEGGDVLTLERLF